MSSSDFGLVFPVDQGSRPLVAQIQYLTTRDTSGLSGECTGSSWRGEPGGDLGGELGG